MNTDFLPDPGAHVTIRTRSGFLGTGFLDAGHRHIGEGFACVSLDPQPEGETLFTYIRLADIEVWTWDCRP